MAWSLGSIDEKVGEAADLKATRERMLHGFWTSQDFMAMSEQTRATQAAWNEASARSWRP